MKATVEKLMVTLLKLRMPSRAEGDGPEESIKVPKVKPVCVMTRLLSVTWPAEEKSGELMVADAMVAMSVWSGVIVTGPLVVIEKALPTLNWNPETVRVN